MEENEYKSHHILSSHLSESISGITNSFKWDDVNDVCGISVEWCKPVTERISSPWICRHREECKFTST